MKKPARTTWQNTLSLILVLSGAIQAAEPDTAQQPTPLPPPDRDIPIVGAWTDHRYRIRSALEYNVVTRQMELSTRGRFLTTVLVLFKNGVAYKGFALDSNLADAIFCPDGFAIIDATKPGEDPTHGRFGKWKEDGDGIHVTWTREDPWNTDLGISFVRSEEKLKDKENQLWVRLKPVDGLLLEGTFARLDCAITFRKDGTFTQENVGPTLSALSLSTFPRRGSGKYEIRKWSLILRFANGFTQSFQFFPGFQENPEPPMVIINTFVFERTGASGVGVARPASPPPAPGAPPAPAPAPVRTRQEKIGTITLSVPVEWFRQDDPGSGTTLLLPPGSTPMQGGRILVFPAFPAPGTHWAAHKAILKSLCEYQRFTPENPDHRPDGPGAFILTTSFWRASPELAFHSVFYTASLGGKYAVFAQLNDHTEDPELSRAVWRMLAGAGFEDGAPKTNPPAIIEAYWTPGENGARRIFLRAGGIADFSSAYHEGMAAWSGWGKVDPGLLNGRFGTWKGTKTKVRIRRQEGAEEEVYVREDGNLRRGAEVWSPLRRVDGLVLEGRYVTKSAPELWINFAKDGTFKTGGALKFLLADLGYPPSAAEPAAGTYEVRDWTIFFKLDKGDVWSTECIASFDEEDVETRSVILLRGFMFKRET